MTLLFQRMAIAGVGLIGGSLARAVKEHKVAGEVVGVGRNEERLKRACEAGIIDRYTARIDGSLGAIDLVVIATPVCTIAGLVEQMIPFLKEGTVITDVGSVKKGVVAQVESFLPETLHFVGGHPIAGTENSGFEHSFAALFENRKCILTPVDGTDPRALKQVQELWSRVGSVVVCLACEEHDEILAAVSHLPHIIAYGMVNCLLTIEGFEKNIFSFSAGGFKDFTRIAGSDPAMWRDIALMNRDKLLSIIERFQSYLGELKEAIEQKDGERLFAEFQRSRAFKQLLE